MLKLMSNVLALAFASVLALSPTAVEAQSWSKTGNCSWVTGESNASAVVWERFGYYTIPSGSTLGTTKQFKCWGSSSTAPPWEAPFQWLHNTGAIFSETISGTIPTGKLRKYHWEWLTDRGVQEWTNGTVSHRRDYHEDYNCFLEVEEIDGTPPPGEGN